MTPAKGYMEMKDSGIEWVGMIPAHWGICKIKYTVTQETLRAENNGGYIGLENVESWSGKIIDKHNENVVVEGASLAVCPNDILFGKLRPYLAKCAIAEKSGCCSTEFIVMRPHSIEGRFLKYVMLTPQFIDMVNMSTYGAKMPRANWDFIGNALLAMPSRDEQAAIASYLDAQCAKIDEIIAQAKASIEDYKQWKASIIYEAVTKGLDPNAEMKDSGVEWIGKVPKEWKAIPLKVCTSKIGSGKTPQGGAETYQDNGVLFLRSQNVYNTGLELDGVYYISDEIDSTMKNSRVRYNDVLLNITGGSIGRCCLFDLPDTAANVNQHVCIIRTRPEILLPQFLRYFWNSAAGPMVIDQYQTGSNRQGLNFEQIGATHIPLCSIAEQRQIVAMLDQKCAVIDQLMAEKQSLIDDLESYKKSLIYEVVTGKRRV